MKNIFLDTDILLDFLGDRKPFSRFAVQIFSSSHNGQFRLHTSANSITTAYYILCKTINEKKARELITDLMEYMEVIPVTDKILYAALNSEFNDFEDAVQHFTALTFGKIECIVTRNLRDYKKSQIKTVSPEELFN